MVTLSVGVIKHIYLKFSSNVVTKAYLKDHVSIYYAKTLILGKCNKQYDGSRPVASIETCVQKTLVSKLHDRISGKRQFLMHLGINSKEKRNLITSYFCNIVLLKPFKTFAYTKPMFIKKRGRKCELS